jgi:predicted YcjX-like family ATPase
MTSLSVDNLTNAAGTGQIAVLTGNKLVGETIGSVYSGGMPVQIGRHEWTDTSTVSSGAGYVDATNGSFIFRPVQATSKLLVIAELAVQSNYASNYTGVGTRILRDGTVISYQTNTHESYYANTSSSSQDLYQRMVKSVMVNATATTATTFKIQLAAFAATSAGRINQGGNWMSSITVWEIAQ